MAGVYHTLRSISILQFCSLLESKLVDRYDLILPDAAQATEIREIETSSSDDEGDGGCNRRVDDRAG